MKLTKTLLIVHLLCVLVPISIVVVWAFTASWPWPNLLPASWTQRGVAELFTSGQRLGPILAQSIGVAIAVALLCVAVATAAARALSTHRFPGRELFRFATVLPFLIPSTVFAMGIQVLFIRMGLAGSVLGVVIAHSIVALPYAITIMSEVTRAAGSHLEEQARVLGSGPVRCFFQVQMPQLAPGLLSAGAMAYIISFSQYFLTLLIGGGSIKTLATVMFPYLAGGDRTIASAYGIVFLVVTFGVFLLLELLVKRAFKSPQSYFEG